MAYLLPGPSSGEKRVSFDDCERHTGTMVEIKDGYTDFLRQNRARSCSSGCFWHRLCAKLRQLATRPVRWYFSEKPTADFAKAIFEKDLKLRNIDIEFRPWPGRGE